MVICLNTDVPLKIEPCVIFEETSFEENHFCVSEQLMKQADYTELLSEMIHGSVSQRGARAPQGAI